MSNPASETVSDGARVAVRLGADYLLRSLQILAELGQGDLITALVSLAIVQANVAHLDSSDAGAAFADIRTLPPDELRRPVSVLSLSASLGLPYETTRRHVGKLLAMGACKRVRGGVVVPTAALDTAWHREHLGRNLVNLRRLVRGLKAAGIDLA